MQNGLNESFWDGLGVEIGACTIFNDFPEFQKKYGKSGIPQKIRNSRKLSGIGCSGQLAIPVRDIL